MSHIGMSEQSDEQRRQFEAEALHIIDAAAEKGLALRLLGSLAFQSHCSRYGYLQKELGRAYTDIDYAGYSRQASSMAPFLKSLGYEEDHEVNVLYAGQRMIFHHPQSELHIDIFFDRLNFCHEVNWSAGRLERDKPTIPLAEMLLEKMQIVKINEKDIIDTLMLLLEHPLGDSDQETINLGLITGLCAKDWRLWRTVTMNLEKVAQLSTQYPQLSAEEKDAIQAQVEKCLKRIDEQPKSTGWKIRSKIGDRVKWYQDVDDLQ
jgi:hypothetical protein